MSGIALALAGGSFGEPPPTVIGQAYGGGYYGGKINVSGTQYYLVVADITVGQVYAKKWATTDTTTGITSVINGPSNSASLSALGSGYEAARFCEDLNTGGYTDWYLPAKNELATIYYFLKPSTDLNNTASGSTANAVSPQPVSTNYSSGSPAQTSATNFQNGASSQEFSITGGSNGGYWTSTENGFNTGWRQAFKNGDQDYYTKNTVEFFTRAIRRVAV